MSQERFVAGFFFWCSALGLTGAIVNNIVIWITISSITTLIWTVVWLSAAEDENTPAQERARIQCDQWKRQEYGEDLAYRRCIPNNIKSEHSHSIEAIENAEKTRLKKFNKGKPKRVKDIYYEMARLRDGI